MHFGFAPRRCWRRPRRCKWNSIVARSNKPWIAQSNSWHRRMCYRNIGWHFEWSKTCTQTMRHLVELNNHFVTHLTNAHLCGRKYFKSIGTLNWSSSFNIFRHILIFIWSFQSCSSQNILKLVPILGTTIGCLTSILQGGLSYALFQVVKLLEQNPLACDLKKLFYCISYYLNNVLSHLAPSLLGLIGPLSILPTPGPVICSLINSMVPHILCALKAGSTGFLHIM